MGDTGPGGFSCAHPASATAPLDLTPTRPEHVLLVVEVVSPGSGTTDRIVKTDQYAKAGIPFYWRVEQSAGGLPIAC
ncbi:Uma2 family endonuclease [Amycolatopsis jiangsuensis]|uniref:Uma2 family endonuclease n=1 Tax=Amycolatopsis jiangsuensis TaxID=1181879 RepID=UPI0028B21CAE|nr:Uma2 family endonuclease [Amycolatopsis jiangsuensis]